MFSQSRGILYTAPPTDEKETNDADVERGAGPNEPARADD
jgi:hypothetical protein